jgi:hypothetical protein
MMMEMRTWHCIPAMLRLLNLQNIIIAITFEMYKPRVLLSKDLSMGPHGRILRTSF